MGGVRGTVGKNNCNNYVKGSDCLYGWENGVGVRMGCYGRMLLMLCWNKDHKDSSALCYVWSRKIYVKLKPVH